MYGGLWAASVESGARAVMRFGPFELDEKAGELRRDGVRVRLQPQPMKVLALLASRSGELVSREEIRRAVWGEDTFVVFDQSLGFCLGQIRTALGDSAQAPRYVQTVPRRGYRFLLEVRTDAPSRPVPDAGGSALVRIALAAVLGLPVVLALAVAMRHPGGGGAARVDRRERLLVLPFDDLGGEAGAAPLGDALTEEMIAEIGRLNPRRLLVIARSTAMRYKGSPRDLERLRHELDVDYALEGSLRLEGRRVRITTRLVRLVDEAQVWVGSHDCELGDLLSLERHVAADTARQVRVTLTPQARLRVASARTAQPEVSRLTLVATHHAALRTPESLEKAAALFRQAIDADPDHAPAWAGLADVYLALGDRNLRGREEAFGEAEVAALRAITLDPGLGAAHAALGGVAALRDWDWASARAAYDQALALNPGDSRVLRWYSQLMLILGHPEDALVYARRATEVDPLSVLANDELACALLASGRYEEALAQMKRVEQLDPSGRVESAWRARALLALGRADEALRTLDADPTHRSREWALARAQVLRALGRGREARARLRALLEDPRLAPAPREAKSVLFERARVLAALGERDRALGALERSVAVREPEARWMSVTDEFEPLREEPRFRKLCRALGIEA